MAFELDLNKLNKEQKEAVLHKNGPLLVIAGAGTGKTTVITQRIIFLIKEKLAKPEEILALTFTDSAAEEMEERVQQQLPLGYYDLWISTFHSFCERILKEKALEIGISPDFKVLDETSAWILVRQNFDKFSLKYYKPLGRPTRFIRALISHFSRCKDQEIYPEDYLEYAQSLKTNLTDLPENSEVERIKELAEAYHTYQQLLFENNTLDFGDLIIYTLKLFRKRPAVLEEYRKKFKYILVDEFQDTNWAQYELVKLLSAPANNLTVTADDDQSIYKFRGASYNNIIQFRKDFPNAKEISLVQNYRSSQNILDIAYKFIQANNPDRLEYVSGLSKNLKANTKEKGIIEHLHFKTLEEEAEGVVNKILEILKKDKDCLLGDFAILVRTNESANPFIRALERAEVPYHFLASRGLYSRPVILDVISYFKLLDNYHESSSAFRVLNFPFFDISTEDLMRITYYSKVKTKSIYETLKEISLISGISQKTKNTVNFLLALIEKHTRAVRDKAKVSEIFVDFLEKSGYLKYLSKKEDKESLDFLNLFYKKIKNFEDSAVDPSLKNFMEQLEMEIESGEQGKLEIDLEKSPDVVRIMTIHSAKGLEFKYVFLVNMVDKKFPVVNRGDLIEVPKALMKEIIPKGEVHLQEERRLCYVGMTRAKRGLFFTSADDYGGTRKKKLSRFLIEMGFSVDKEKEKPVSPVLISKNNKLTESRKQETKALPLPPYLSFSQIAAFKKCPLQYKFAHILKIPAKGQPVYSFGKTIHRTLYEFVKSFTEQNKLKQKELFSFSGKKTKSKEENFLSLEDLISIYEKNWIEEWFESPQQKQEYYKLGREIIKNFYKKFLKEKPEIFEINGKPALELSFKIKLSDSVLFSGQIDRIDKTKKGLKIIDYKTGNIKEKLTMEEKEQLLIYQIAVEKILGEKPSELAYYYLEDQKEVSFLGTEEEKEKEIEEILRIAKEIRESDFAPTPGWQCKYCDFKDICEFAKDTGF